jgi:hypothetical protein
MAKQIEVNVSSVALVSTKRHNTLFARLEGSTHYQPPVQTDVTCGVRVTGSLTSCTSLAVFRIQRNRGVIKLKLSDG